MGRSRKSSIGKKINPTFFIFCEGKTEELYVKNLKSKYRIPLEIATKITKNNINETRINKFKKSKWTHKKDKTFLLYDIDAPKMLERLSAIKNAILLVSNPCIELWYLLHLKEQTASIDTKTCIKALEKALNKKHDKTKLDSKVKELLDKGQLKAVNRARKLKAYNNPSSTIYLLLDALNKVKK